MPVLSETESRACWIMVETPVGGCGAGFAELAGGAVQWPAAPCRRHWTGSRRPGHGNTHPGCRGCNVRSDCGSCGKQFLVIVVVARRGVVATGGLIFVDQAIGQRTLLVEERVDG